MDLVCSCLFVLSFTDELLIWLNEFLNEWLTPSYLVEPVKKKVGDGWRSTNVTASLLLKNKCCSAPRRLVDLSFGRSLLCTFLGTFNCVCTSLLPFWEASLGGAGMMSRLTGQMLHVKLHLQSGGETGAWVWGVSFRGSRLQAGVQGWKASQMWRYLGGAPGFSPVITGSCLDCCSSLWFSRVDLWCGTLSAWSILHRLWLQMTNICSPEYFHSMRASLGIKRPSSVFVSFICHLDHFHSSWYTMTENFNAKTQISDQPITW